MCSSPSIAESSAFQQKEVSRSKVRGHRALITGLPDITQKSVYRHQCEVGLLFSDSSESSTGCGEMIIGADLLNKETIRASD